MGCGCRKNKIATKKANAGNTSASRIKVARTTPRVPVTKRLPRGTRVRQ